MPTQRIIKSTFIGLNNEPLRNAVVQVIHMEGNTIDNIEYPQVTKNFITNREGKINFILWCNEEGERASFYRFILPGGETFDAIVPVGTSDLELSVLREGGGNSSAPQNQSLITYILNEIGGTLTPATSIVGGIVKTNSTSVDPVVYLKSEVDTLLANIPGGGTATTASNVGTAGTGIFKQKTASNLEFKNINAGSTKISITNDSANSEIDVDVVESNLTLGNLSGTLPLTKGGTGSTSAAAALTALGAASSTSLTTHTSNVSNPHSTTAAQVGAIPTTDKGIALGVATLDSGAKIPDTQIPDAITRDTELTAGLATKADVSTTYTKTETNTLLTAKANQSTTYTKTEVDNLVAASDTLVELTDVVISSPSNTQVLAYNSTTSKWTNQTISAGGTGETNTASNVGVGGVGVFKQKTGANLEFRNINAASTKVTVVSDTANNEIDIDVTEANLTLGNIGGTLPITKGGTGATSASAALTALGGATTASVALKADIASPSFTGVPLAPTPTAGDSTTKVATTAFVGTAISTKADTSALTSHTGNTSNPHSTTASQVGAIATTARGTANGVASLDSSTLVPDAQLPTTVARTSDVTTSLTLKANLASPTFTGTVAVPNQTAGDSSTKAANTAFVTTGLSTKADSATVTSALALKADTTALTTHISDTANPHGVTASQVGNTVAQWNASQLRGKAISTTAPTSGQVLVYNSATDTYEPSTVSGGGGGGGAVGAILQVKTAELGTEFSYVNNPATNTTTLFSISITPGSTSSKFLLSVNLSGIESTGLFRIILLRNSTVITERRIDPSASSAYESCIFDLLDSPATTSAITYSISIGATTISTNYVNRLAASYNQGYSSLVAMEVGAASGGGSGSTTLATLTDVAISSPTDGQSLTYNATTSKWVNSTVSGGGGSGEINTASNIGTAGVGIFKQKTGVNFELKKLNSGSTKVSITDDTTNNEVDVDVVEANLTHDNIGGTLSISKGGTGATSASAALTALGAIPLTQKGAASGVATLDSSTLVPDAQISSNIARTATVASDLALKANLASPTFSGVVAAPTPTAGDNTTKIATTAFVTTAVSGKADTSALTSGLATKADSSTVTSSLALKADLASPVFTGTVTVPTPTAGDSSTKAASTAFVSNAISTKADTSALTSHTSNTSNPHSVTAAQVGSATAQWNASQLRGVDINTTAPTSGQVLTYNSSTTKWEAATPSGGGGGASNGLLVDITTVNYNSSTTVSMFTLPANAEINRIEVLLDVTWVTGTAATLSVGIAGNTSKYMPSSSIDLYGVVKDNYITIVNLPANTSSEAIITTYAAGTSSAGRAIIHVYYSAPS